MNILHLTHTDINSDSRILKEMQSISTYSSKYKVSGIGVTLDEEQHKTKKDNEIDIYSINLISRKWSLSLIKKLLPIPDKTYINPFYRSAAKGKLFLKSVGYQG